MDLNSSGIFHIFNSVPGDDLNDGDETGAGEAETGEAGTNESGTDGEKNA